MITFVGYDVATIPTFCTIGSLYLQHTIFDTPALCRETCQFSAAPTFCGLTVPKEFPAFAHLLLCEYIICSWSWSSNFFYNFLLCGYGQNSQHSHCYNIFLHNSAPLPNPPPNGKELLTGAWQFINISYLLWTSPPPIWGRLGSLE